MALAVGREEELLAQLHDLLFLPSSPVPAATPAPPVKVESAAGPLASMITGSSSSGRGRGSGLAAASSAMAGDGRRRQRRQGSKRDWDDDDDRKTNDERHEETAKTQPHYSPPSKRRKKTKQQSIKSSVTSVPDFDGYKWRKYGQKQIEGATYPRSYYRCTRSAEQGCAAKRTVQRNDDAGDAATTAAPEYTVVYVGEHTCTANDSLEAPVILETTAAAVVPPSTSTTTTKGRRDDDHHHTYTDSIVPAMSAGSCSTATTTITNGTESSAISGDDITCCWSSTTSGASSDYNNYATDDYYCSGLFGAATAHDGGCWATTGPADAASSSSLQDMQDLTGPIRSPVHVPAAGWTIDQLLMELVNEPVVCHF